MASSGIQDFRFVLFEAYQLSTPSLELNNKGNILDKHSIFCLTWEKVKLIQACTLEKYEIHLCCLKKKHSTFKNSFDGTMFGLTFKIQGTVFCTCERWYCWALLNFHLQQVYNKTFQIDSIRKRWDASSLIYEYLLTLIDYPIHITLLNSSNL